MLHDILFRLRLYHNIFLLNLQSLLVILNYFKKDNIKKMNDNDEIYYLNNLKNYIPNISGSYFVGHIALLIHNNKVILNHWSCGGVCAERKLLWNLVHLDTNLEYKLLVAQVRISIKSNGNIKTSIHRSEPCIACRKVINKFKNIKEVAYSINMYNWKHKYKNKQFAFHICKPKDLPYTSLRTRCTITNYCICNYKFDEIDSKDRSWIPMNKCHLCNNI